MPSPASDTDSLVETALLAAGRMAFRYDPARDHVTRYGAVRALTGRDPDAIGPRFADTLALVHPEDRAAVARIDLDPAMPGAGYRTRFRFVHPDGSALWCEALGDFLGAGGTADGIRTGIVEPVERPEPRVDQIMRLAELIEYLPEFVSVHTASGRCLTINSGGRRLIGIDATEDVGRFTLSDLLVDSTSVPVHMLLPVVLAHESHATEVVMSNRRSGRQIPAYWSATVMREDDSGRRHVVCIARDMTRQLETEWALRQNQRRLTHALEVSRLGEWSMDIRTRVASQSRRVAEIFGYSNATDAWNNRVFLSHVHPDDRGRVERLLARSIDTGRDLDFEARIIRNDGALRWISAKASMNRGLGGDAQIIGGVIQDITARKFSTQRDRFLADVSVPLNTLVDHRSTLEQVARLAVPFLADHCSIDIADEQGRLSRIVSTSSLLAREALGDDLSRAADEVPEPPTAVRRMIEAGEPVVLDIVHPDMLDSFARTSSERLSLRALNVKGYLGVPLLLRGRHIGVLHFYRTDTEVHYSASDKAVAEELAARVAVALENSRLYQALQDSDHRKDEFLAMLSHELRNPLASLSVGVSLMESDDTPQASGWARTMMRGQITKLSSILEDLLDVSRYTFNKITLDKAEHDLAPLLIATVDEIRSEARERGYELVLEIHERPIYADVDGVRISQIIGNLLTNALKYGGGGGRIVATLGWEDGNARLVVTDEGVGIDAAELPNVFELFSQVQATIDRSLGGLGMGLTLVKRVADMHGGTVLAESAGAGTGTRMTIVLPAWLEPKSGSGQRCPGSAPVANVAAPAVEGQRLLLVDDNVETVTALQKLFLMKGYEVETANDGLAALELAESFQPELAVLDIGLPGADGYEIASTLRRRYDGRPLLLIALSGYGQEKDRVRSKEAGFDHHLLKPVNFKSIVELLRSS